MGRHSNLSLLGVGFDPHRPYQTLADSAVFPHLYVSKQAHQRLVLRPSCAQVLSTGSVLESGRYFRRGDGQEIKYHRKWKLVGSMDHAEGRFAGSWTR